MKTYRRAAVALWLVSAACIAGAAAIAPASAAEPAGTWYTGDKDSQVRIVNCGGAICGTLVWLKEPNDPATGKPKLDKNNADAASKAGRCSASAIVLGMKPSGPKSWSGNRLQRLRRQRPIPAPSR